MRSPQTLLRYYSGRKMGAVGSRLPVQSNTNPLPGGSTIPGWLTAPLPACSRHNLAPPARRKCYPRLAHHPLASLQQAPPQQPADWFSEGPFHKEDQRG